MIVSPSRPPGFDGPDKEEVVLVLRSLDRAMLLAELSNGTECVPSSALSQIPVFFYDNSSMPRCHDEETILLLMDLSCQCLLMCAH